MSSSKINLVIFVIFVIIYCSQINGAVVRHKRQMGNFLFPDDERLVNMRPNPGPITQQPVPSTIPSTGTTTTTSPSNGNGSPTTPSPDFIRCMKICPTTSEYNPVCGSDQFVYRNEQKLICAQRCGSNVQMAGRGNCQGLFGKSLGLW